MIQRHAIKAKKQKPIFGDDLIFEIEAIRTDIPYNFFVHHSLNSDENDFTIEISNDNGYSHTQVGVNETNNITLPTLGRYIIKIVGQIAGFRFHYGTTKPVNLIKIHNWGKSRYNDIATMFVWTNLETIDFTGGDFSRVKEVRLLTSTAKNIIWGDSKWLSVTSIREVTTWNDNIEYIDLSPFKNAENLENILFHCNNLKEINWGNNTLRYCKRWKSPFYSCAGIESIDLSSLNLNNIVEFRGGFLGCKSLTEVIWGNNTLPKNTILLGLFDGCESMTNFDLSSLNLENVTQIDNMFKGCKSLISTDQIIWGNQKMITANDYITATDMFANCTSLNDVTFPDIFPDITENGVSFSTIFFECSNLKSVDFSNVNLDNVRVFVDGFRRCSKLEEVIWGNNTLPNCITYSNMFYEVPKIVNLSNLELYKQDFGGLASRIVNFYASATDTQDNSNMLKIILQKWSSDLPTFNRAKTINFGNVDASDADTQSYIALLATKLITIQTTA